MTSSVAAMLSPVPTPSASMLHAAGAFEVGSLDAAREVEIRGRFGAPIRREGFLKSPPRGTRVLDSGDRWTAVRIRVAEVLAQPHGGVVSGVIESDGTALISDQQSRPAVLGRTMAGAMKILSDMAEHANRQALHLASLEHFLEVAREIEGITREDDPVFQEAFFESTWAKNNVPHRFEGVSFRRGIINFIRVLVLLNVLKQTDPRFVSSFFPYLITSSLPTFLESTAAVLAYFDRAANEGLRQGTRKSLEIVASLGTAVDAIEEMLKVAQRLLPDEAFIYWSRATAGRFANQPTSKFIQGLRRKIHVAKIRLNQ